MAITNRKHGPLGGSAQRLPSADTRAPGSLAEVEVQAPRDSRFSSASAEMTEVVNALSSVERICLGLLERIRRDSESDISCSPPDVSQCSIDNTENASRLSSEEPPAAGPQTPTSAGPDTPALARQTRPELRQTGMSPLPVGLIDLTSEGSCDSTTSSRAGDQEVAPDSGPASGPSGPSTQSPAATPPNSQQQKKYHEVFVLSDDDEEDGDGPAKPSPSAPWLQPEADLAPKLVPPSPTPGTTTNSSGLTSSPKSGSCPTPTPSPNSASCPTPSPDTSLEDDCQVVPRRDCFSPAPSLGTPTEDRGQFVSYQSAPLTTPQNAAAVRGLEQVAPIDIPMRTPSGAPEEEEAQRLTQKWASTPVESGGDQLGSLWEGLGQYFAAAGVEKAIPPPDNPKVLARAKKRKVYNVNAVDPQPIQCAPGGNGLPQVEAPPSSQARRPRGRPRKDAVQERDLFGSKEAPDTANAREGDEPVQPAARIAQVGVPFPDAVLPAAGTAQAGAHFPGAEDAQPAKAGKAADNSQKIDNQPLAEAEMKAKTGDEMGHPLGVARAGGSEKGRSKRNGLLENEFDEEDEDEGKEVEEPVKEDAEISQELRRMYMDEKIDYVPYTRKWDDESPSARRRQDDEDECANLAELFQRMEATIVVAPREVPGRRDTNAGCPHTNFDFDEYSNWYYCDDCGAVEIEIPSLEEKKPDQCVHKYEFSEEIGSYCIECGRVCVDIEKMFVLETQQQAARKQVKNVDGSKAEAAAAATGAEQEFQLPLYLGSSLADSNGSDLELHPYYKEKLQPHQKKGFKFLRENLFGQNSMGCVLAHAPGTGKTFLMISFIESFLSKFEEGRPLILAPKIMLRIWHAEFKQWEVRDIPIYGINGRLGDRAEAVLEDGEEEETRVTTSKQMKKTRARVLKEWQDGGPAGERGVMLMSYTMFALLVTKMTQDNKDALDVQIAMVLLQAPNLVILDEGHLARNDKSKISQALLGMDTKRRVLLSGSLFQNNFKELFTLLKLCRGDFMANHPQFRKKILASGVVARHAKKDLISVEEKIFNEEIGDKLEMYASSAGEMRPKEIEPVVMKMQTLTAPFVDWYQGEILKSLPGLLEYSVVMELTVSQKERVGRIEALFGIGKKDNKYMLRVTKVMAACVHPSLVDRGTDDNRDIRFRELNEEGAALDKEANKGVKVGFILQLLTLLTQASRRHPEKVLIFCSTLTPLNYLEQLLCKRWKWKFGVEVMRLDGRMQDSERQMVMQSFSNKQSPCRVMLASTKACKEGISLVAASRVIILDNPENPAVVRQAVSRAYRIGQTRKVFVYRLVTTQKDEDDIFRRTVNKERLSQVLLDPVATMARLGGFLREQTAHDVEDPILKQLMRNDRDSTRYINTVYKYNASG